MTQDPASYTPSFYDDLAGTLDEAWRVLGRGAVDRRSPLHTPAVATTGIDGQPQVRTVVLRGVDKPNRTLRFHSDARSGKFAELTADPRIAVLGYDAGHKIQLRVTGRATLHTGDNTAAAAWAKSQAMSRMCYRQAEAPGTALAVSAPAGPLLDDGSEHFVVVSVAIHAIEWLYLAHAGHRRARFVWTDGELTAATWLAP
jgi:pyridoxamine 5'-phosphate oxidase